MYYTESEKFQIGRVRHRWAATYKLFSFSLFARYTPSIMREEKEETIEMKTFVGMTAAGIAGYLIGVYKMKCKTLEVILKASMRNEED